MKASSLKILLGFMGMGLLACSCEKKNVDIDLTANDWKVEKIRSAGQNCFETTDSVYILQLREVDVCYLNLDVNTCGGEYEIPYNGSIDFQLLYCTEICCDTDFANDLAALFPLMTNYYVRNNRLHLEGDGEIVLLSHD